jgi:hypothetical protein
VAVQEALETLLEPPTSRVRRVRRRGGQAVILERLVADVDPHVHGGNRKVYRLPCSIDLPGVIKLLELT